MRRILTTLILSILLVPALAQNPVLAVNRVDKYTGEKIRQTSLYTMNDALGKSYLNISLRAIDEEHALLINVPKPINIKKGTSIKLQFVNGAATEILTASDIISISSSDVNKKLMVLTLTEEALKLLRSQPLSSIRIPETSGSVTVLTVQAKDRGYFSKAIQLVAVK